MARGESKTSPRRISAAERQRQALELRKAGVTFDKIAQALGYKNRSAAYVAVQAALRKTLEKPSKEYRQLNAERLNTLLFAVWQRGTGGDLQAIAQAVRIIDSLNKMLGLDDPAYFSEPEDGDSPGGALDLSRLSDTELETLRQLHAKAQGKA